ncbi:OLC1v1025041C1 [Oldenlandia corymbosa var. corymbosa]|uniref:OLC1v1025041C1 n=1 Tax=Oldenlandia corymbosa var. corymbosa TaxID=529605 RepID=A0AAV1C6L2_OLDCO|nr:OLC1v1025041C1 [Oldenlandia corymbosa var. corymbosa]
MQLYIDTHWGPNAQLLGQFRQFYVIRCANTLFRRAILYNGPYAIDGALLLVRRWVPYMPLPTIYVTRALVWVRLYGLPPECFNVVAGYRTASLVGHVAELQPGFRRNQRLDFLRARVWVDLREPLLPGFYLQLFNGRMVWIQCRYERIYKICRRCGLVGHPLMRCPHQNEDILERRHELQFQRVARLHNLALYHGEVEDLFPAYMRAYAHQHNRRSTFIPENYVADHLDFLRGAGDDVFAEGFEFELWEERDAFPASPHPLQVYPPHRPPQEPGEWHIHPEDSPPPLSSSSENRDSSPIDDACAIIPHPLATDAIQVPIEGTSPSDRTQWAGSATGTSTSDGPTLEHPAGPHLGPSQGMPWYEEATDIGLISSAKLAHSQTRPNPMQQTHLSADTLDPGPSSNLAREDPIPMDISLPDPPIPKPISPTTNVLLEQLTLYPVASSNTTVRLPSPNEDALWIPDPLSDSSPTPYQSAAFSSSRDESNSSASQETSFPTPIRHLHCEIRRGKCPCSVPSRLRRKKSKSSSITCGQQPAVGFTIFENRTNFDLSSCSLAAGAKRSSPDPD